MSASDCLRSEQTHHQTSLMDWVIQDLCFELINQHLPSQTAQLTHLALPTAELSSDGGISDSDCQSLLGRIGRVSHH